MASEIRVNKINNRAGLGTITIADTGVVVNGIVTCTEVSGLNVLNIAGVSTFASTLDINGDIDVDGHTNLDNLSVAGVSTFSDTIRVGSGVTIEPNGQATFTGIVTFGSGSTTINNNVVNVGTALTLGHTIGLQYHTQNLHAQGFEVNQINASGIVTASAFKLSDGSNVGGVDSDTNDNTTGGTDAGSNLDISSPSAAQGNTLFGHDVGKAITTGEQNTAVGNQAMLSSQTADYNSVFGRQALQNNVSGHQNTAVGNYALNETTSSFNTAVGAAAMYRCTGQDNSALGKSAGKNQQITGNNNTLIGHDSELSSANVSNEITLGDSNISLFRIPGINLTIGNNGANIAGVVTATSFSGDGSNLSNLPAGAPVGGASTNTVFFENDKVVAVNYQITSTKNAMSAGPISINAGIAVTVPSGCSWTIV